MKSYNVKYSIGQLVFVLLGKKAISTPIQKIRITESVKTDYRKEFGATDNQIKDGKSGITIEYLVQVNYSSTNIIMNSAGVYNFDWVNQNDCFETRDDLISQIK